MEITRLLIPDIIINTPPQKNNNNCETYKI